MVGNMPVEVALIIFPGTSGQVVDEVLASKRLVFVTPQG